MNHRFTAFRMNTSRQSGLTLVELMIAMVLGLLLLGGVVSVYISGKQSNTARDGFSILQENARVAIRVLESGIAVAGYPRSEDEPAFFAEDHTLPAKWSKKAPKELISQVGVSSDVITVQFRKRADDEPGDYLKNDCLAQSNEGVIVNSYYIAPDASTPPRSQLVCLGSGNSTHQPLADNVEALRALYGIDSDGDGIVDNFVRADAVADWMQVVAVRVAILVSSGDRNPMKDVPERQTYRLLDFEHTAPPPDEDPDRLARRVFTTTIPLRNRADLCDGC